jgi:hypothetical protein
MTTNEHPSEPANVRQPHRATVRLVFVGVAANSLTQFAIQAWMSYRFAKDVWAIPRPLCVSIIVALDLFAVMFMVFTYLLREARWFTKAYVWLVFAVGVGAQLFAAELYGAKEEWAPPVRVFAALPRAVPRRVPARPDHLAQPLEHFPRAGAPRAPRPRPCATRGHVCRTRGRKSSGNRASRATDDDPEVTRHREVRSAR